MASERDKLLNAESGAADTAQDSDRNVLDQHIRTYWWRWMVLIVYAMNIAIFNANWFTFAPIADVVKCYYNVSTFWTNSLTLVPMVVYIILVFPGAWCLERLGLRTTTIIASSTTAVGTALKFAGAGSDHFSLLLMGQIIASICNSLIWGAAPVLSEMWFPSSQRITATVIGAAIAPMLGIVVVFVMGPVLVGSRYTNEACGNTTFLASHSTPLYMEWSHIVQEQLFYYFMGQTVFALATLVLTYVAFPASPPTPPSRSRQLVIAGNFHAQSFTSQMLKFLRNKRFMAFILVCGINNGTTTSLSTLLNEILHPFFPNDDNHIAYLGITVGAVSLVVLPTVGRLLDFTKAFYVLSVAIYVTSAVVVAGFVVSMQFQKHFYVIYITYGLIGGCITAYQAVSYEYAVEMTYPLPEGTSAGLINLSGMVFAIILVVGVGKAPYYPVPVGAWIITGIIAIGAIVTVFIRPELRRVKVDKPNKQDTTSRANTGLQNKTDNGICT